MAQHLSILYDGTGPHQLRLFEFLQKNLRPQLSEEEQVQNFFMFIIPLYSNGPMFPFVVCKIGSEVDPVGAQWGPESPKRRRGRFL
jgi:hypothetical protein